MEISKQVSKNTLVFVPEKGFGVVADCLRTDGKIAVQLDFDTPKDGYLLVTWSEFQNVVMVITDWDGMRVCRVYRVGEEIQATEEIAVCKQPYGLTLMGLLQQNCCVFLQNLIFSKTIYRAHLKTEAQKLSVVVEPTTL